MKKNKDFQSTLTINPKLKTTSSISQKKAKINIKLQKGIEIELKNIFNSNLKEILLDESSSQSSKTNILVSEARVQTPHQSKYFFLSDRKKNE